MKQFIKCPTCNSVELATIGTNSIPFLTYIHNCNLCRFIIMESDWETLPALSIRQPWAWLIVNGFKGIENRNNLKNFTGDFLIHASSKWDKNWFNFSSAQTRELLSTIQMPVKEKMQYGGIIGYATITGYVEKSDSPWFIGKYGLLIKDPHPLAFTPCKGKLSFFTPEIE